MFARLPEQRAAMLLHPVDQEGERREDVRQGVFPMTAMPISAWRSCCTQHLKVYPKVPSSSTGQVLSYLGRHSHKTANTNHRLVDFDGQSVRFR